MKHLYLLLFMLLLLPFSCAAQEWSVIEHDGEFFLQQTADSTIKLRIFSSGGVPHFEKTIRLPQNPDVVILEYYSGAAGTYAITSVYNGLIFNIKTQKSIGDFPYRYVVEDERIIIQPQWKFYPGRIDIEDEESSTFSSILLK